MFSFVLKKIKLPIKTILSPYSFAYAPIRKKIAKYQHLATGKLVDLGCGQKPFEKIFKNIDSYFGVDVKDNKKADLVCDILNNKLKDNYADSILCTQVLEHLREPDKFIHEISRLCRPGGICILTAPLLVRVHGEPYDFFRFTRFGLEYLFLKNNFKVIAIEEVGGFYYTVIFLTLFFLKRKLGFFSYILNPLIILPYYLISFIDKDKENPSNYIVIAKKLKYK